MEIYTGCRSTPSGDLLQPGSCPLWGSVKRRSALDGDLHRPEIRLSSRERCGPHHLSLEIWSSWRRATSGLLLEPDICLVGDLFELEIS